MKRTIIQITGNFGEWALASDSTIWHWTAQGWSFSGRSGLPDAPDQTAREFVASQEAAGVNLTKLALDAAVPPVKRKRGRPRKNP